jgi:hypothetical protein
VGCCPSELWRCMSTSDHVNTDKSRGSALTNKEVQECREMTVIRGMVLFCSTLVSQVNTVSDECQP